MRSGNAAWLAAMIDRPDLVALALEEASNNRETLGAVVAVLDCDLTMADELIAQAASTDAASLYHWLVAAMVRNASGRSSTDAVDIASLLGSTATLSAGALTGDVPRRRRRSLRERMTNGCMTVSPSCWAISAHACHPMLLASAGG